MKLVRSAFDYIYLTEIFHYISEYPFFIWGNSGILELVGKRLSARCASQFVGDFARMRAP